MVIKFTSCFTLKDRIQEVDLNKEVLPSVKTLGVVWMAGEDVFTFKSH